MPQYQGVWTLQQQAQAQSNQQWVTDPNFKNTTLLLQADGTGSGSQNNTFLDGSTNNYFISRFGNTTQGSFSPFSQPAGYWGVYNTIGSYCQLNNADYAIGTGDFTIEFWMYCVDDTSYGSSAFAGLPGGGTLTVSMSGGSSNARLPYLEFGGTLVSFGTLRDYLNKWTHVAFVRTSGNVVVYQNGVALAAPISKSQSFPNCANLYLARLPTDTNQDFRGYLSNYRICKSAVYSSNFTPSALPFTTTSQGATNCQLLTFQDNRFKDNSSNASTVTPTNTAIQVFSPFVPTQQWTSTVIGGSGYFDGTGDYLLYTQPSGLGSGDFTIECWVYFLSTASFGGVFGSYLLAGGTTGLWFGVNGSGFPALEIGNGGAAALSLTGGTAFQKNTWIYLAARRSGSTVSLYVNGVSVASGTSSVNISNTATVIGRLYSDAGNYFNGYISNMRVSNNARTISTPTSLLTNDANTVLLLNSTNAGIYDGTMNSVFETVTDAQVSTGIVKYGSGSISYATTVSTGAYLAANRNTNFYALYTGDFTVEGWIWLTTTSFDYSGPGPIFNYGNGGANGPLGFYTCWAWNLISGGTGFTFYRYDGTETSYTFSGTVPVNQWVHVALTRANGYMRAFVNGVQIGSTTAVSLNYSPVSGTNRMLIGIGSGGGGANQYYRFPGYMDDLRITQGVARYITNFTPPQVALPRQ